MHPSSVSSLRTSHGCGSGPQVIASNPLLGGAEAEGFGVGIGATFDQKRPPWTRGDFRGLGVDCPLGLPTPLRHRITTTPWRLHDRCRFTFFPPLIRGFQGRFSDAGDSRAKFRYYLGRCCADLARFGNQLLDQDSPRRYCRHQTGSERIDA